MYSSNINDFFCVDTSVIKLPSLLELARWSSGRVDGLQSEETAARSPCVPKASYMNVVE